MSQPIVPEAKTKSTMHSNVRIMRSVLYCAFSMSRAVTTVQNRQSVSSGGEIEGTSQLLYNGINGL
jgi:hypothetical protein